MIRFFATLLKFGERYSLVTLIIVAAIYLFFCVLIGIWAHRLKRNMIAFTALSLFTTPISALGILFFCSRNKIKEALDKNSIEGDVLAEEKYILAAIKSGESKNVEFKQTLRYDVQQKGIKEKIIEEAVLKNLVAFLNTDGGILFIGVDDSGAIVGVEDELEKIGWKMDKYLLHIANLIKDRIGAEYYAFIEYRNIGIKEKKIIKIDCKPSPKPCFLDNESFFVRVNPAVNKLEGPKLLEYVKNHFK